MSSVSEVLDHLEIECSETASELEESEEKQDWLEMAEVLHSLAILAKEIEQKPHHYKPK